MIFERNAAG